MQLRPDGEPALMAVAEKICNKREAPTTLKAPSGGNHQSVGGAESAHARMFGMIRSIRKHAEEHLGSRLGRRTS